MKHTSWAPQCPRCFGRSERDPEAPILDCKCLHCGYHHTSPLRRGVLVALSRRDCRCAQCEAARLLGAVWLWPIHFALEAERRYRAEWQRLACNCKRAPHRLDCPARVRVIQ